MSDCCFTRIRSFFYIIYFDIPHDQPWISFARMRPVTSGSFLPEGELARLPWKDFT